MKTPRAHTQNTAACRPPHFIRLKLVGLLFFSLVVILGLKIAALHKRARAHTQTGGHAPSPHSVAFPRLVRCAFLRRRRLWQTKANRGAACPTWSRHAPLAKLGSDGEQSMKETPFPPFSSPSPWLRRARRDPFCQRNGWGGGAEDRLPFSESYQIKPSRKITLVRGKKRKKALLL